MTSRIIYLKLTKCNGVDDTSCTARSTWLWTADDEYVVKVIFHDVKTKTWEVDRQIVLDGWRGFGGIEGGDFTIERIGSTACRLSMCSDTGSAEFRMPRKELKALAKDIGRVLPAPRLPSDEQMAVLLADWSRERNDPLWGLW